MDKKFFLQSSLKRQVQTILVLFFMIGASPNTKTTQEKLPNKLQDKSRATKAPEKANGVTLWSRSTGPHHDTPNPPRVGEKFISYDDFKPISRKSYDAQYGRSENYKGIPLKNILNRYKPQAHDDAFILHFANKMAILMPRNSPALRKLVPWVALEICTTKNGPCESQFPEISKDEIDSPYQDPRPLQFLSSKFVVQSLDHPDLINPNKPIFSPWKYVDSLIGIEFVNQEAYKKQFFFGAEPGEKVFWQRCQYCHGVRLIGSRMGWDLVTPLPVYEKRSPEILLNHIKYPKIRAKQMGLMMPNQPDMELQEAESLWKWLKSASRKPSPEYRPL